MNLIPENERVFLKALFEQEKDYKNIILTCDIFVKTMKEYIKLIRKFKNYSIRWHTPRKHLLNKSFKPQKPKKLGFEEAHW